LSEKIGFGLGEPPKIGRKVTGMEMATCSVMNQAFIKFSLKTSDFTICPRVSVRCKRGDRSIRTVYPKDITDEGTGG
jgi:hypothetical protein